MKTEEFQKEIDKKVKNKTQKRILFDIAQLLYWIHEDLRTIKNQLNNGKDKKNNSKE